MRIEQLYRPDVITADAGESLATVAHRMWEHRVGAPPILEDEFVIGIISERDLARALAERADPETAVACYVSPVPSCAGAGEDSMRDLLALETWLPVHGPEDGWTEVEAVGP